jgi:5-formyltetrahydrofolate cyclo-ligase
VREFVSNFSREGAFPLFGALASAKRDMRVAVLAARRAIAPEVRQRADDAIAVALAPLVTGKVVCAYDPMPGEPGGGALRDVLAGAGRLLLPVLLPDLDLDWAAHGGGPLVPAGRGPREPSGPRLGVDAVTTAALVVVPAVAVDRRGLRLGRGGGSYDRALARATGRVVAVLYDGEIVPEVPAEAHDRPVHAAVTPTGVIPFVM